jgi:hypothetical protein
VLTLFRQNTLLAGIIIVVLTFMLRIPTFLAPQPYEYIQTAPFPKLIFPFLQGLPDSFFWSVIINAFFVGMQAVLLNYIISSHGVLHRDSALPGLFFVLINSLYPLQMQVTPQLISNTLLLLLFQRLCYLYESANPLLIIFDAGMCLGIGVLFNYDMSLFLPFILISVVIFTSFNLRYLIISLIGILVPLYFTFSFFYLSGSLNDWIHTVIDSFYKTRLKAISGSYLMIIPLLILGPIAIISGFELQSNFFRNKVKTRRILQAVGLMILFGILGLFLDNTNFIYSISYLSVPAAIIIAYYFISTKRWLLKELLLFALIGLCFFYQIQIQ